MSTFAGIGLQRIGGNRPVNKAIEKIFVVFLVVISCASMTGCTTFIAATSGPDPPDLSKIQVGASRQVVERELGSPVDKINNVSTYEYNTQKQPPLWFAATIDVLSLGTMAVYGPDMLKAVKAQRAKHGIIFGPRDTVIGLSYEKAEADYLGWLLNVDRKKNLEDLCKAANAGYPEAQAIQAARYRYGLWDTESQPVQAYVWLRLAELGGHPEAQETIADMTRVMRPDDVSEADRLFNDWSPSSCEP